MSWPATLGVALLAAVVGMLCAGYTANLIANWFRISSFEGQAGYFVVLLGLLGFVLGLVIGIVVARNMSGFLPATGASLGVVLGLTLLVLGISRLSADVPPTIDGDALLLALEYRWPASQVEPPSPGEQEPRVRLGSVSGSVERNHELGAFWLDESRQEDGRWITPAAVEVFTARGKRVVLFTIGEETLSAVMVPLPGRPKKQHLEWSDWLPADSTGSPEGASYRFRVQRVSEPYRVEQIGPFEIATRISSFGLSSIKDRAWRLRAYSSSTIRHAGEPVVIEHVSEFGSTENDRMERAFAVALVNAQRPALLACMDRFDHPCFLLVSDDGRLRTEHVDDLQIGSTGHEATSEPERFERSKMRHWSMDRVDRTLFETGRIYRLSETMLDTRGPVLHRLQDRDDLSFALWEPPVGLAPDGNRFARNAYQDDSELVIAVTDLDGGNPVVVHLDPERTPFGDRDDIDAAWVHRYFEWATDANGAWQLVERRTP